MLGNFCELSIKQEIILIAEDNHVLRLALDEMLSLEGFVVMTASNGIEALSHMEMQVPDRVRSDPDWLSIPLIFLTAHGTHDDILTGKNLGAEDYLVKPLNRIELITAVRSRLDRSRQLKVVRLREAYEASLTMLANAIEARDRYTRGHVERVTAYVVILAKHLGWQGKRLEELRFGAILHDIGKIHVQETTLCKDGLLNPDEWEEIRQHPITGSSMVKDIPYLVPAIPVIRNHHECWDGSGYPDGLAREEIPIMARIVSVGDAFDAITPNRAYRNASSIHSAYDEILEGSEKYYDPNVVSAFTRAWEIGEIQRIAENINSIPK